MDLLRVIGVAMATVAAVLLLRPHKPEIAALVGLFGGLMVVLMFVESLQFIIDNMANLVQRTGVRADMFSALLRIIGIGYLTEFAASVCDEAGNNSMAKKVTLAGKVLILILALPIVNNLIEIVADILP
ncbi:MAG: stage III sporulation AC/AD family protein [Firmicutes bacterium]|nr:stage III sporulation AC/AD family protein [Bacillota bacterium]